MEVELFKSFAELSAGGDLFARHFSLYHALYSLKQDPALGNSYLHCDPMRIRLRDIPVAGYCREYLPDQGEFCSRPAGSDYCDIHAEGKSAGSLIHDPLTAFYLDPDNIIFGSDPCLAQMVSRVMAYGLNYTEIEKARLFMGLERLEPGLIKDRYRHLARLWHPDRSGGSEELMRELNRSCHLLCELMGG